MENNDINTLLFRCSSIGHIMPGVREKAGQLDQTVVTHLVDCFVNWKYKRREEINSKYFDKGNEREDDSITLLSLINKKFYKKNNVRLYNEFINGEFDLSLGEPIEETIDTKTSWSAHTFFRAKQKRLDDKYKWQGIGYMWLTGAKKHTVAYCLVNGTDQAIIDEKRKLSYRYGIDYDLNQEYRDKCKQIEINHIFDIKSFTEENPHFDFHNDLSKWTYDIPMKDRVFTHVIERNEAEIESIKNRVIFCRNWIKNNLIK